jgi:hypothetical protein
VPKLEQQLDDADEHGEIPMANIRLDFEDFEVNIDDQGDAQIVLPGGYIQGYLYKDEIIKLYEEIQEMRDDGR